jgi:ABC-type uncharacterized transport system ATPase subunit
MTKAVQMFNITRRFGNVIANNNVTFEVEKGEIHALVGENGAGKTTLMNILYGLVHPDEGEIKLFGKAVSVQDPHEALMLGIGMVHQHFMLSPSLTVLENIILGCTPSRFGLVDVKKAEQEIQTIIQKYAISVELTRKVHELSVGEMQCVEILKALFRGADVFILDEPSAVLTPQETKDLFEILRGLAKKGFTLIFITHKLKEVMAIADRVTVMQRGRVMGNLITKDTNEHELACLMVGREVVLQVQKPPAHPMDEVLVIEKISARNDRGLPALKNVSFALRRGEILGIAGVEGNGQSELIQVLSGLRRSTHGNIFFHGKKITDSSPRQRREAGIAHIPEDRLRLGLEMQSTIEENIILDRYYRPPLASWIFLNMSQIQQYTRYLVERFNVMAGSTKLPVSALSGGNMQKLILAREMDGDPEVLIAAQPTRGVDVGAIEYIHLRIIELREKGNAILLVSSELEEITSLSDRILVMYEGEIVGEFQGQEVTDEELGLYMAGARRKAARA